MDAHLIPLYEPLCLDHFLRFSETYYLSLRAAKTKQGARSAKCKGTTNASPPKPTRIQPRRAAKSIHPKARNEVQRKRKRNHDANVPEMTQAKKQIINHHEIERPWDEVKSTLIQNISERTMGKSPLCVAWRCRQCELQRIVQMKELGTTRWCSSKGTAQIANMETIGEEHQILGWSRVSPAGFLRCHWLDVYFSIDPYGPLIMVDEVAC